MNPFALSLSASLTWVAFAAAQANAITNLWLDDRMVVEIPLGLQRVTTVSCSQPIESIDAAGITTDGRIPGLFQLAHAPGHSSFALRALEPGATANMNIRLGGRTYVLILKESKNPILAVNFQSPVAARSPGSPSVGDVAPVLSTSQLLGLLDKARGYVELKKHHPQVVADVTVSRPRTTNDYAAFRVVVEEVFRFDDSDALVFRVSLSSKIQREVRYRPGSWAVRVGERLYSQALADSNGVIPAVGQATAWFVIQGGPDGERNGLSPRNTFIVLVNPL